MNDFFRKLDSVEARYEELGRLMSDPAVTGNNRAFQDYAREHSNLGDIVELYREFRKNRQDYDGARELVGEKDAEMRDMALADIARLEPVLADLEQRLKVALLPKDPNDAKNVILEVRAGTGGEEASLFAGDLLRMYTRYAERRGWRVELMSASETGLGGYKEVVLMLSGKNVYSRLKYEAGVHRVQRVPATEAQGRVHTSACTVAVLPEADEVDVKVDPKDLRIDVFRSSGPGGQSVNTTDSAVRITHIPTGVVVSCQDEKSQLKNKVKAMKVLLSRLLEHAQQTQHNEISAVRKEQVGSGDRSAKIRTYNFPQARLTDHRIGLTLYNLQAVVDGDLDQVIDPLIAFYQAEALKGVAAPGA